MSCSYISWVIERIGEKAELIDPFRTGGSRVGPYLPFSNSLAFSTAALLVFFPLSI